MNLERLEAVVLDLDGVITQTEAVHARAWKATFDAFLRRRTGEGSLDPFDLEHDYKAYVDGRPRYDGVRTFLSARQLQVEEGAAEDEPGTPTVYGLGNEKHQRFLRLLEAEGVEVYPDAVEQLRRWRAKGIPTAVVSSSRNCVPVLRAAGVEDCFDVKVDGNDRELLRLRGKPAPDMFLEATRQLGVEPARSMMVEDAVVGVEAGRAAGFGRVIGVSRTDGEQARALAAHGADRVVRSLRELDAEPELRHRPQT